MLLRNRLFALILICAITVPVVAAVAYSSMANATGYGDDTNSPMQSKTINISYCTDSDEYIKRYVVLPCDGNVYSGHITFRSFDNPGCITVNVGAGNAQTTYIAQATSTIEVINVDFSGTMLVIDVVNDAGFSNNEDVNIAGVVTYQTSSNVCTFP